MIIIFLNTHVGRRSLLVCDSFGNTPKPSQTGKTSLTCTLYSAHNHKTRQRTHTHKHTPRHKETHAHIIILESR